MGSDGLKELCIICGAHWRNLANTTEPSVCGGDAALRQITCACLVCRVDGLTVLIVVHGVGLQPITLTLHTSRQDTAHDDGGVGVTDES